MKILVTLLLIVYLIKGQILSDQFIQLSFEFRSFYYLNVTQLGTIFVDDYFDCSFTCLQNILCFSFNLAAFADVKGKLRCELLTSTRYNDTEKLTANDQFHHYSIQNPCASGPCMNNGICSSISFRDGTYECTCHPGYLGDYCEIDPNVTIPLTWPEGTYGLPMPKEGCPPEDGVTWHTGTRYQDTEDSGSNNQWSSPFDLAWDIKRNDVVTKYCIKTDSKGAGYPLPWPKGSYCIHKKGDCPEGFTTGWIKWDDEDSSSRNQYSGTLPQGEYTRDTKMYFCCRSDGFPTNAIALPNKSPFVLLKFGYQCQHVHDMKVREEFFKWDCENSNTYNTRGGTIPAGYVSEDIKIHYCYYDPN